MIGNIQMLTLPTFQSLKSVICYNVEFKFNELLKMFHCTLIKSLDMNIYSSFYLIQWKYECINYIPFLCVFLLSSFKTNN